MLIGVLQVELLLPENDSPKEKRRVVHRLKERLHRRQPVSVAEVDALDSPQRAILGIVLAANDRAYANRVLQQIVDQLRLDRDAVLGDHRIELLQGM